MARATELVARDRVAVSLLAQRRTELEAGTLQNQSMAAGCRSLPSRSTPTDGDFPSPSFTQPGGVD
jgi:hypothetical protein